VLLEKVCYMVTIITLLLWVIQTQIGLDLLLTRDPPLDSLYCGQFDLLENQEVDCSSKI